MKRPYLLGHFDGDGFTTVSRSWGPYEYARWGITGTAAFLGAVRGFLSSELGIAGREIYGTEKVAATYYVTGRDALAVDEWLHAGLDFGLQRKRLNRRRAA